MRKASTQLVLVVAIVQGLMFANRKHLYDSSRMVVTYVRAQAYGCNSSSVSSSFCSTPRGPNSGVGQSHLTNRPVVHNPLMNASLPPVHARRIPSALSCVQQPEPNALPSPGSLLFQHEPQHPLILMSPYHGNPYPPPVVQTPMPLTTPQYTPVGTSAPGEMATPHPSLGHPSLVPMSDPSVHPSLHQPNPPFDDRAILPQPAHHPNIRVTSSVPTKVDATATPPIWEVTMHSNPSTPPPPVHLLHHPLSRLCSALPILIP